MTRKYYQTDPAVHAKWPGSKAFLKLSCEACAPYCPHYPHSDCRGSTRRSWPLLSDPEVDDPEVVAKWPGSKSIVTRQYISFRWVFKSIDLWNFHYFWYAFDGKVMLNLDFWRVYSWERPGSYGQFGLDGFSYKCSPVCFWTWLKFLCVSKVTRQWSVLSKVCPQSTKWSRSKRAFVNIGLTKRHINSTEFQPQHLEGVKTKMNNVQGGGYYTIGGDDLYAESVAWRASHLHTNLETEAEPQQIVVQGLLSCLQYPVP